MVSAVVGIFHAATGLMPKFKSNGGSLRESLALQNVQVRIVIMVIEVMGVDWSSAKSLVVFVRQYELLFAFLEYGKKHLSAKHHAFISEVALIMIR